MPLQEGIYFDKGQRPGTHWGMLFLRVTSGVAATSVDAVLAGLSQVYASLQRGRISDLPGVILPTGDLTVLFGFGPKAFAINGAQRAIPQGLGLKYQFASPIAAGGGSVLPGSGLSYSAGLVRNPATEEFAVQAIANTSLAVARVFVETQKYLDSNVDPDSGQSIVELASGYTGFNRDDGRSWIDFHDGLSNLESGPERLKVLAIKNAGTPLADRWTVTGTYLTFMRIGVDLRRWRELSVADQELAVGRAKISGCPFEIMIAGTPVAVAGCPVAGTGSMFDGSNDIYREPPRVTDPELLRSHVQRANHHQGPIERDVSQRIFRQGYEFLEPPLPGRPLDQGLNFVSFQDTVQRVFRTLTLSGWLGSTNFGGSTDSLQRPLLTVRAAGNYLCPPTVAGEEYPGQSILRASI